MPKYSVTFERSAYEIKTIVVEAGSEAEAEELACDAIDGVDCVVVSSNQELFADTESEWDHMDTEVLP